MVNEGYIDSNALDRSLKMLREQTADTELDASLRHVLSATRQLFGCTGAGFMMIDESAALSVVAATDAAGHLLEERQQELGHGPCVDALTFDHVVVSSDLATDIRWPSLGPELTEAGVRAVLGVPIHASGVPVGSLNVYRDVPGDWSGSEISALEAYADLIERLLLTALHARASEQLSTQLQHALDNRVTIERAVGVVMARDRVDAVESFNRLRKAARDSERRVADIAADLLARLPRDR